jgi:hypothetical protein
VIVYVIAPLLAAYDKLPFTVTMKDKTEKDERIQPPNATEPTHEFVPILAQNRIPPEN